MSRIKKLLISLVIVLVSIGVIGYFLVSRRPVTRINIAVPPAEEGGPVTVLSFERNRVTIVEIPGNTIVHAAGDLGDWPAKSLWKLGQNEGAAGQLMAYSITKTFSLPITDWAGSEALNFTKGGMSSFKLLFTPFQSSLSLQDRLYLVVHAARIDPANKRTVSLQSLSMLITEKDDRGELVYIVRERTPVSLLKFFDEETFSANDVTIGIEDGSNDNIYATEMSRLLSVIGGKVVSVERKEFDGTCRISGEPRLRGFLLQVLPCEVDTSSPEPFDIKVKIGTKFKNVL